jgi:hypothetical protein
MVAPPLPRGRRTFATVACHPRLAVGTVTMLEEEACAPVPWA